MIVADTNLLVHRFLPGEQTALAERVLERDAEWLAPLLWRSELRNVLMLYLRAGGIELPTALLVAAEAEAVMKGREFLVATPAVMRLSTRSSCSAYDCEFVALAEQRGLALVTSDRGLQAAFPEIATAPKDFVGR